MSTTLKGCLHDTRATFAPTQVHSGYLSWFCICLHDNITKFISCRRESHRRELTPVVVPEREFHSGTKTYKQVNVSKSPQYETRTGGHPSMKLAPVQVLSCKLLPPPPHYTYLNQLNSNTTFLTQTKCQCDINRPAKSFYISVFKYVQFRWLSINKLMLNKKGSILISQNASCRLAW